MRLLTLLRAAALCLLFGPASAGSTHDVIKIVLSMSNVHLVRAGDAAILVDAGGKGDLAQLEVALVQQGLRLEQLRLAVLTHGHSDHAGLGAELMRRGVPVMAGEGDLAMMGAGHNDDLLPTNLTAWLLKRFAIDPRYEPFRPTFAIKQPQRLDQWGIAGQAVPMAGHTAGSLVIELDDGQALVGDMMLGGWLGGALAPSRAGEHYFQADTQRNRANIAVLLRRPVQVIHLGHGGPVTRESVLRGFGINQGAPR